MAVTQAPLIKHDDDYGALLSLETSERAFMASCMSNFVMTSLSDTEREDLMVKLWEQHDVVDVMKLTGYGEGLEEERLVQVFGEESARM
jgi:leucyl aminopeptidase